MNDRRLSFSMWAVLLAAITWNPLVSSAAVTFVMKDGKVIRNELK